MGMCHQVGARANTDGDVALSVLETSRKKETYIGCLSSTKLSIRNKIIFWVYFFLGILVVVYILVEGCELKHG